MTVIGEPSHSATVARFDGGDIRLSWAVATDVGRRRASNEDSAIASPPVFAVADGMGGHAAGDIASAAAVERLSAMRGEFATRDDVTAALRNAADDIDELSERMSAGAGTTVTGVVVAIEDAGPAFLVFNLGDSRVYRFERNALDRITKDHSVVQELVDAGMLAADKAEQHPESNVITRALGFRESPLPDYSVVPLRPGVRMLICSDGLTREVEEEHIRLHLASGLSAEVTADALVDAALASGGRDNVTVLVVDVLAAPPGMGPERSAPRSGAPAV